MPDGRAADSSDGSRVASLQGVGCRSNQGREEAMDRPLSRVLWWGRATENFTEPPHAVSAA
jgi:hypothetical protein